MTLPAKKRQIPSKDAPRLDNTIQHRIIVVVSILLFIGSFSLGLPQYAFAAVRCMRQPVIASDSMAGHSYSLPGDPSYGPNIFAKYFCTEQDAHNAGYYRAALVPPEKMKKF